METKLQFKALTITPHPSEGLLQVSAQLQHTNDKGSEELVVSVRLPAGDRSLQELQRELIARTRLLLEAADDDFHQGQPSKLDVWTALAK